MDWSTVLLRPLYRGDREAADACGLSPRTLEAARLRRDLAYTRCGRRVLISRAALVAWLEGRSRHYATIHEGAARLADALRRPARNGEGAR